jgi:hypothetical protein
VSSSSVNAPSVMSEAELEMQIPEWNEVKE